MLDIGLEIRILRERKMVSAKDLAEKIGLSQSQMSRLEKGQRRIDTQVLDRIARALEVDPSHFFRGEDAPAEGVIPPSLPEAVGKLIRAERRRQHVSAEDLALKVGKPKAVLQAVEDGKRELDPELAEKVLKALRLPPNYFLRAQQEVIHGLETQVARLNEALAESSRSTLILGGESIGGESLAQHGDDAPGRGVERRGIPVLGSLADGYPQRFDATGRPVGEVTDFLYVPGVAQEDAFALHAVGDSMERDGAPSFREGDLLIFTAGTVRSRDFGFVRIEGEDAVFRQVFFDPAGQVRLQPLDLNRPARVYPRERILAVWRLVAYVARI